MTNQLTVNMSDLIKTDAIDSIEDKSDLSMGMKRAKITFKNGKWLSVITGPFSYGGEKGLFEIMPSDTDDFDEKDRDGDDVLGFLSAENVNYYINKIGNQ